MNLLKQELLRSPWRCPESDPPKKTGKILVLIDGCPHLVTVEEEYVAFWDPDKWDEAGVTYPSEWDAWMEIPDHEEEADYFWFRSAGGKALPQLNPDVRPADPPDRVVLTAGPLTTVTKEGKGAADYPVRAEFPYDEKGRASERGEWYSYGKRMAKTPTRRQVLAWLDKIYQDTCEFRRGQIVIPRNDEETTTRIYGIIEMPSYRNAYHFTYRSYGEDTDHVSHKMPVSEFVGTFRPRGY